MTPELLKEIQAAEQAKFLAPKAAPDSGRQSTVGSEEFPRNRPAPDVTTEQNLAISLAPDFYSKLATAKNFGINAEGAPPQQSETLGPGGVPRPVASNPDAGRLWITKPDGSREYLGESVIPSLTEAGGSILGGAAGTIAAAPAQAVGIPAPVTIGGATVAGHQAARGLLDYIGSKIGTVDNRSGAEKALNYGRSIADDTLMTALLGGAGAFGMAKRAAGRIGPGVMPETVPPKAIATAEKAGVPEGGLAAYLTQNPELKARWAAVSSLPGKAGNLVRDINAKVSTAIEGLVGNSAAGQDIPVSPTETPSAVAQNALNQQKAALAARDNALTGRLPPSLPNEVANQRQLIKETRGEGSMVPATQPAQVRKLNSMLNARQQTWRDAREASIRPGRIAGNIGINPSENARADAMVYGAIREDMNSTMQNLNSMQIPPKEQRSWLQFVAENNNFSAAEKSQAQDYLRKLNAEDLTRRDFQRNQEWQTRNGSQPSPQQQQLNAILQHPDQLAPPQEQAWPSYVDKNNADAIRREQVLPGSGSQTYEDANNFMRETFSQHSGNWKPLVEDWRSHYQRQNLLALGQKDMAKSTVFSPQAYETNYLKAKSAGKLDNLVGEPGTDNRKAADFLAAHANEFNRMIGTSAAPEGQAATGGPAEGALAPAERAAARGPWYQVRMAATVRQWFTGQTPEAQAKLLANPQFGKWLLKGGGLPFSKPEKAIMWASDVGSISAEKVGPVKDALDSLHDQLNNIVQNRDKTKKP